MQRGAATAPTPRRRARRRQAAGADRDQGGWADRRVIRVPGDVLDADAPATGRRGAGHRDVAAEADEHAAVKPVRKVRRRQVRGARLCRGAEIEPHARGHGEQPGVLIQPDLPPARSAADGQVHWRPVLGDELEVTVVAERRHRRGYRRVQVAIGDVRRVQCDGHGIGEHGTDVYRRPRGPFGQGEF